MEPVQTVEQVFFPLDEKLELQPGSLTPLQLSYLMHFATVVSFERAAKFLMQHHGVYVSASTSRRQTEAIGAFAEVARRGFFQSKQICAVSDGAEWIQRFIDAYRADTVRILDFYHAAEYISTIAELVRDAGTTLPESWLAEQLHELKYQGPKKVLEEVHNLLKDHPHIEELAKLVNHLRKREKMMQYPLFMLQG